eukprot:SAG11_NODE_21651_length_421_cov_0.782609_1_plen_79_part_10
MLLGTPTRYMAVKDAVVRLRSDLDSDQVGLVLNCDVVSVTHTKMVGDEHLRLRVEFGWLSVRDKTNTTRQAHPHLYLAL